MSKPVDFPVAATDANYPAGANPWNGTDTKVEPTSGRQAEGYEPAAHLPAQEFNWYLNLIYLWIAWFEEFNTNTKTLHISAANGLATNFASTWDATELSAIGALKETPLGTRVFALDVPVGATIVNIRARVKDNVTGPTTIQMTLLKAADASATALGSTHTSSGAGTWQSLTETALNEVTVAGTNYQAVIATASGAAAGEIAWVEVDYIPPPT